MAVKDFDDWDNDFDDLESTAVPRKGNTTIPAAKASASAKGDVSKLTEAQVKAAIIGSVGDIDSIAASLGVDRVALRRHISSRPSLKEAIDDEIMSARERVVKQTYEDAINGSQAARQDFFKMTGGMFDKKEDKAAETQQIIIKFTQPQNKFKVLNPSTGETGVVGRDLKPIEGETIDADYADSLEGRVGSSAGGSSPVAEGGMSDASATGIGGGDDGDEYDDGDDDIGA